MREPPRPTYVGGGGVVVVGRKKQRRAKMTADCPLFLPKLTHTSPTHFHDQRHLRGQQQDLNRFNEVDGAGPNLGLNPDLTQHGWHAGFGQRALEQLQRHVAPVARVGRQPRVGKRAAPEQADGAVLALKPWQRGRVVRWGAVESVVGARLCRRAAAGEEGTHDVFCFGRRCEWPTKKRTQKTTFLSFRGLPPPPPRSTLLYGAPQCRPGGAAGARRTA